VDEAVEQTRRFGQGRASGFVNAVLRKATRDPSPPLPGRDSPVEYARVVLSHPPELFQKLQALLGTEDALRFCEHDQLEAPTIVRLGRDVDPSALAADGVTVTPHEQSGMYVIDGAKRSHLADWATRGVAQVQDPTAASVVAHVTAQTGERLLDRCAGLGTKTLQLRDAVGDGGQVVAMDPAQVRCRGLQRLLDERKIANVAVRCSAWLADLTGAPTSDFDRVLADVPCSNSGVLARRPEARYAQGAQSLRSLAKLQDQILSDTASALKPGGTLVYSTCSVWPEENRQRVDAFLKQHSEYELMEDRSTLPTLDSDPTRYRDGGYWAQLRRK
jgi:16S rRNA (cytosine967-C5)-methyltransferase